MANYGNNEMKTKLAFDDSKIYSLTFNGDEVIRKYIMPEIFDVEVVYDNDGQERAVRIYFADGGVEKAAVRDGDTFNLEYGIVVCLLKKILGGKTKYGTSIFNKLVKRALYVKEANQKNFENAVKEYRAKEAHEEKLRAKKQARKAKRREEEDKRQTKILKEAIVDAVKEMSGRNNADVEINMSKLKDAIRSLK